MVFAKTMKFSWLTVCLLFSIAAIAQDTTQTEFRKVKKGFGVSVTQVEPSFPGGPDSLESYLKRKLVYPPEAIQQKMQGRVYVGFLVDREGKIRETRILSSAGIPLDNAALEVVESMPKWTPGTAGGSPVDVQYVLPIDFRLPQNVK